MPMTAKDVVDLVDSSLLDQWHMERARLDRIDGWLRWEHDKPHMPRQASVEYKELSDRSQTPWLQLVVTSVAQALYVDGHRRPGSNDSESWAYWQANGMDSRQIAVHRAALAYGASYVVVLPGTTMTGQQVPSIRGVSPRQMMAFYDNAADDDWPTSALRVERSGDDLTIRLYDDQLIHHLKRSAAGGEVTYVRTEAHNVGICPVVRYANQLDLEGRTDGEVEPFIPVAGRIDQTVFDRLVVQRFSAFVVRTVTGMAVEESAAANNMSTEQLKMLLRVGDLLASPSTETQFGSLPATPLDGFIKANEADVRALAAVTQTPAHELLGQMANLSAEALAAARASLSAKVDERKHTFGESHEQTLRLAAHIDGNREAAEDYEAQVRWKDTEIRSLAQAADALGKLATMLGLPVELLWEKVPGLTQQDIDRAKVLVAQGEPLDRMVDRLLNRDDRLDDGVPVVAA